MPSSEQDPAIADIPQPAEVITQPTLLPTTRPAFANGFVLRRTADYAGRWW